MQPHRQNRLFRHLSAAAVAAFALLAATSGAADTNAPIELAGDKPAFTIEVSNAKAKLGESATIKVSVKAAPGFKCNDKYKHKIKKLKADRGAKLAANKVMGTVADEARSQRAMIHLTLGQVNLARQLVDNIELKRNQDLSL